MAVWADPVKEKEKNMSLDNAQRLVLRMREDKTFRSELQSINDNEILQNYLREQGYEFEEKDLIKAMAACMTGLDQIMQG